MTRFTPSLLLVIAFQSLALAAATGPTIKASGRLNCQVMKTREFRPVTGFEAAGFRPPTELRLASEFALYRLQEADSDEGSVYFANGTTLTGPVDFTPATERNGAIYSWKVINETYTLEILSPLYSKLTVTHPNPRIGSRVDLAACAIH